ncbi:MAG: hypothetical protein LBT80_06035, partial [Lactobacillaceae bacterium]|nr:hypothetical protein [Lactobacillaceae bacterium]
AGARSDQFVGKARVAEYGEPAPDIKTHNGHGAGPLADLSPYLCHPFPTNLSLPESPSQPQFHNNVADHVGNQQNTSN